MKNVLKQILADEEILNKYRAIDKINPYPFSHGIKHIHNVLALTDKIAPVFQLTERETLILKVCEALHDLGQVDGRENHGQKAAKFAREYLKKFNEFSSDEIDTICSAISTHDEKDFSKLENKFSWFVALIDKMDFSCDRLEDDAEEKFGYTAYQDIVGVEFAIKNKTFIIKIILINKPKLMNENLIYNYCGHFFNNVCFTAKAFCNHFGLKLDMKLNNTSLTLSKFEIA